MAERTCTIDGCDGRVKARGLCQRHYDRFRKYGDFNVAPRQYQPEECSVQECTSKPIARGWCRKHYYRWKTHGDPRKLVTTQRGEGCDIAGCDGERYARGWCRRHYSRWQTHGDPLTDLRPQYAPTCTVDGCDAEHMSRGYCRRHYQRWSKHGDPTKTLREEHSLFCQEDGCGRTYYAHGWCHTHYARWRSHGDPNGGRRLYETPEESFMARTEWVGECLEWTGKRSNEGYGGIIVAGRQVPAHRYAWERERGPIPDGLFIDHRCHNPSCVNVEHLRLATPSQNMQNRKGLDAKNASGFRGVSWSNGLQRWIASVGHRGQLFNLGSFETAEEAAEVARAARLQYFTHNDIDRALS